MPFRPLGAACFVVGGGTGEGKGGEGRGGASDNCFFAKLAELNEAAASFLPSLAAFPCRHLPRQRQRRHKLRRYVHTPQQQRTDFSKSGMIGPRNFQVFFPLAKFVFKATFLSFPWHVSAKDISTSEREEQIIGPVWATTIPLTRSKEEERKWLVSWP